MSVNGLYGPLKAGYGVLDPGLPYFTPRGVLINYNPSKQFLLTGNTSN